MDSKNLHSCWRNMKEAITLVLSVWTSPPSPRFVVRFVCHFRETENEAHLFCQTRNKETTEKPGKISVFSRPFSGAQKSRKCPSHFSKWSPHSSTHYWEERSLLCTYNHLGWKFALFDHIALQISHADNVQPLWQGDKMEGIFWILRSKDVMQNFPREEEGRMWRIF